MKRVLLLLGAIALAITAYFLGTRQAAPPPATPEPTPPSRATAATHYIDATNGDDINDGLSEASPWRTLSRLNQAPLLPGSTILLHRGGIWRESLNLTASGDTDAPITIGAYGEGDAPSIRGSDAHNTPAAWRYESEGLWFVDDIRADPGILIHDGQAAIRRSDKDALADAWDFWYDGEARRLYVRLDSNPAAMAELIEAPTREFVVGPLGASHLRLTGLDIRHPIKTALLLWEADHIEIEGCTFTQSPGTHVQIGQGANYTRITGCTFDDWNLAHGGAYALQALEAGSGPADVEDCTFTATHRGRGDGHTAIRSDDRAWIRSVRACRFLGKGGALAGDGISVWRPNAAASTLTIEDNIFQELGGSAITLDELDNYGGALAVSIQRNRISGLCRGDYLNRDAVHVRGFNSRSGSVLVACNIITGTHGGQHPHAGIGIQEARAVRIIHNAVQGADDGIALRFGAVDTYVANNILLANRGVGLRMEGNASTSVSNAYFENAGGPIIGGTPGEGDVLTNPMLDEQLRPLAGSPCIDRGVDAGLVADVDRKPVPSGLGPDIGPYEQSPPH